MIYLNKSDLSNLTILKNNIYEKFPNLKKFNIFQLCEISGLKYNYSKLNKSFKKFIETIQKNNK